MELSVSFWGNLLKTVIYITVSWSLEVHVWRYQNNFWYNNYYMNEK